MFYCCQNPFLSFLSVIHSKAKEQNLIGERAIQDEKSLSHYFLSYSESDFTIYHSPHCVKSHIFVQKLNFDEILELLDPKIGILTKKRDFQKV